MKGMMMMMNSLTQIYAVTGNISTFYLSNSQKKAGCEKKAEKDKYLHPMSCVVERQVNPGFLPAKKKLKWEKSSKISHFQAVFQVLSDPLLL